MWVAVLAHVLDFGIRVVEALDSFVRQLIK
jgi:hypothetical protein